MRKTLIYIASTFFSILLTSMIAYGSDKLVETKYLSSPKYITWENETTGTWSSVKNAKEYQVKLFLSDTSEYDDTRVFDFDDDGLETIFTTRTSQLSYDFSGYMNDMHSYFFAVRAVPKANDHVTEAGKWVASNAIESKRNHGVTGGRWRNYLSGSKYQTSDGTYLSAGWNLIDSSWYYLDTDGYRKSGWITINDVRFYLDDYGRMSNGWFFIDDDWYYANKSGEVQTGWIREKPGAYYYLGDDGIMQKNLMIDGFWLNSDGMAGLTGHSDYPIS